MLETKKYKKIKGNGYFVVEIPFVRAFSYLPEFNPEVLFKLTSIKVTLTDSDNESGTNFVMDSMKIKTILKKHITEEHNNAITIYKKDGKIPCYLAEYLKVVKVNFVPSVEGFAKYAFEVITPIANENNVILVSVEVFDADLGISGIFARPLKDCKCHE